jgi:hypothetical protein
MDVIRSMPDRDPPHPGLVIVAREPGPVHDGGGDLAPLLVGHHPVPRRSPDRAVPHGLLTPAKRIQRQRQKEQPSQPPQIWRPIRPLVRFKLMWVSEPSHQVRVRMLIRPAWPVQIPQQSCNI